MTTPDLTKSLSKTPTQRATGQVCDKLSQVIQSRRDENTAKKAATNLLPKVAPAEARQAANAAVTEAEQRLARNPHAQAMIERDPRAVAEERRQEMERLLISGGFPMRAIRGSERESVESFGGGEDLLERLMVRLEAGGVLFILGNNGTGKDVLATMLAREWIKSRGQGLMKEGVRPAAFDGAGLLIGELRHDCYTNKVCSEKAWLADEAKKVGLRVLDELDKMAELERTTPSTFLLECFVKLRHDRMDRPTICLANYTEEAYEAKVPASIRDRAAMTGKPVVLSGESWRRQQGRKGGAA